MQELMGQKKTNFGRNCLKALQKEVSIGKLQRTQF